MTRDDIRQKAELYMEDFHNTELSKTDLILFAEQLLSESKLETIKEVEKALEVLVDSDKKLYFKDYKGKISPISYVDTDNDKIIFME